MHFTNKLLIYFCLFLIIVTDIGLSKDLPESFTKCRRKDTQFDECLRKAVEKAINSLRYGLADFGIWSLEPLDIPSLVIENGANSAVQLKQSFKNLKLGYLVDSVVVTKYKTDLDKFKIWTEAFTPRMEFISDYEMSGRILLLPITGKGRSNVTMYDLTTKHELIGEPVKKNGELYMRLKKYNVKLIPKRMTMHFENLFNGDKLLGRTMNNFLNENWEIVFDEVKGGYEDTFGYIFKEIANKIFLKVPMNKIFLED